MTVSALQLPSTCINQDVIHPAWFKGSRVGLPVRCSPDCPPSWPLPKTHPGPILDEHVQGTPAALRFKRKREGGATG